MNNHLGRNLAASVDVACVGYVERFLFTQESVAPRARVNPHSAGEEDAGNSIETRRFKHIRRAIDIQVNGVNGILVRVVDVGDGCQMKDILTTFCRLNERREIQYVYVLELHV